MTTTYNRLKYYIHRLAAFIFGLGSLFVYLSYISYWTAALTSHGGADICALILILVVTLPVYICYNHLIVCRFIPKKYIIALEVMLPVSYILISLSFILANIIVN